MAMVARANCVRLRANGPISGRWGAKISLHQNRDPQGNQQPAAHQSTTPSENELSEVSKRLAERWLPLITSGRISPIIHATLPLEQAADAHALVESNTIVGKVILTVD